MHGNGLKRIIACLVVAACTALVGYGANRFTDLQLTLPLEAEEDPEDEALVYVEQVVLEEPDENDKPGRLKYGDYTVLSDLNAQEIAEMEAVHADTAGRSRYLEADVTGDGKKELLWLVALDDMKTEAVIAVFTPQGENWKRILWDPETEDDFYLAGRDGLVYIRKNEWAVSEFHCTEVLFDRDYELYGGEGLTMFLVADEESYLNDVDAAVRKRLSDITGRGVWYYTLKTGQTLEEAERTASGEWMERFTRMTGEPFAYVAPSIETIRTGTESGLAKNMFLARRVEEGAPAYEEAVYYPQLAQGDRKDAVNNLLRKGAFAELLGETEGREAADDPDAYFTKLINDLHISRTSVMDYGVITDTDALLSVLFSTTREENEESHDQLSFLTIDKRAGRQVQLGDLTGVENIVQAIRRGAYEVYYVDTTAFTYTRDTDETHDEAWMLSVFEQTRAASDNWKKVGLDEQYLFLAVVTDEEQAQEAVLRIPRWDCGMTSPGHMALFMHHPLYPYLRGTLDMAQSLMVRKEPDGFLVSYATKDGGTILMDIYRSDTELPENGTAEEERDFFERRYTDITAYAAGTLSLAGEKEHRYFALEQNYGEGGFTFLETGNDVYVLKQQGSGTRDLLLTDADSEAEGLVTKPYCSLYDDGMHDVLWHNFETGGKRLSHEISDGLWFDYTLYPADKPSDGYASVYIAMREGEGGVQFATGTKDTTYTFRDVNDDGYDDLTFGEIDETDHSKERNFIFHEGMREYVDGPSELEKRMAYRFEDETGYCLIDEKENVTALYAFDEEGVFTRLRTLDVSEKKGEKQFKITAADEEKTVLLNGAADEEAVNELFTSVFLWQGLIDVSEETDEKERFLRVIVTTKRSVDIIDSFDTYRIFLTEDNGKLYGYVEPERFSGILHDIAMENGYRDNVLTTDSALLLYYGEEDEAYRIDVKTLLQEAGYE